VSHAHSVELSLVRVLVSKIEHLLFMVEAAVVVAQLSLVEGLGLVVAQSVGGADLVGVLVALGAPAGAIPVLTVHGVARAELLECLLLKVSVFHGRSGRICVLVNVLGEVEVGRGVEDQVGIAGTEVGVRVDLGVVEAGPGGGLFVVCGVVAGVREMPCLGSEPARAGLTGDILLGDQRGVESGG